MCWEKSRAGLRSLHKRPIEPRRSGVTSRVKEQIQAGEQIGQGKQIHPIAARQIGAVLHHEVAAQPGGHVLTTTAPAPHSQRQASPASNELKQVL